MEHCQRHPAEMSIDATKIIGQLLESIKGHQDSPPTQHRMGLEISVDTGAGMRLNEHLSR